MDPQTLAIDVDPLELTTSETRRRVYGKSSADRHHVHQGPLGEGAVTDVAAAGAAEATDLADAVRREVVVVDVALAGFRADRVEPLLFRRRAQGHRGDDLGLATGEDRGTVGTRQVPDFDPDRPDIGGATTVGPNALFEDAGADFRLEHCLVGFLDLAGGVRRRRRRWQARRSRHAWTSSVASRRTTLSGLRTAWRSRSPINPGEVRSSARRCRPAASYGHFSAPTIAAKLTLQFDNPPDVLVGDLDRLHHPVFRNLLRLPLDHHDRVVGSGDHHVHAHWWQVAGRSD